MTKTIALKELNPINEYNYLKIDCPHCHIGLIHITDYEPTEEMRIDHECSNGCFVDGYIRRNVVSF
jgi:hypothetical protein